MIRTKIVDLLENKTRIYSLYVLQRISKVAFIKYTDRSLTIILR